MDYRLCAGHESRLAANARKVALERHGRTLMNQRYEALLLELAR